MYSRDRKDTEKTLNMPQIYMRKTPMLKDKQMRNKIKQ